MSGQESPAEACVGGGLLQLGALSTAVSAQDLLNEAVIIFITYTVVWSQVALQGGKHSPTHQQKIGKWWLLVL